MHSLIFLIHVAVRDQLPRMRATLSVTAQHRESGRNVGRPVPYFTSDRSFADEPLEAALSTREWNARRDSSGNGLGDTWRVAMSAVFEAPRRTLR